MIERHLKTAEVAETLGVSVDTVRRLAQNGRISSVRIGNSIRFPASAITSYLDHESPTIEALRTGIVLATGRALDSWVYFIQSESGPIKVGVATNPATRFAAIQADTHERLVIRGVFRGTITEERAIHAAFRADRIRGEWFEPSLELLRLAVHLCDDADTAKFVAKAAA